MPRTLHTPTARRLAGFTLIEVMVTVAIVAILAAVAVPQYRDYVTRGRIPDATSALAAKQVQLEQYFQDNRTYVNAPACASDTTTSKFFTFACTSSSATAFVLAATGKSSMTGFTYTVNQASTRATTAVPTGWTTSTTCWVVKKDGSC
jgi:type IV pilus assembly protein PilE